MTDSLVVTGLWLAIDCNYAVVAVNTRSKLTCAQMTLGVFYGRARAHLLNVGIIRPAAHVSAIDINAFLSDDAGAPVNCGKVSDQDKGDVPRFLNRCARPCCSPADLKAA